MPKKLILLALFVGLLIVTFITARYINRHQIDYPNKVLSAQATNPNKPPDYTMVMVGDSMTERLGNSDEIKQYLAEYYPDKKFLVLNYGFGSTNILSLQERLEKETFYGRAFQPILDIDFNLILIESFGQNPLSQFPLDEGLKKHNQVLDTAVAKIKSTRPNAQIAFVATIAPSKTRYAETQINLSPEKRAEWASERIAYIKNHMDYAKSHNIPLVDVFDKSLDRNGGGNLDFISTQDFIHPSPTGIYLISQEIANFIHDQKIF